MRKVELRMNESFKYEVIKKLVDSNGNKKRAALKLNCSVRTINRLIVRYNTLGKQGFIHGNRGKSPANTFNPDLKKKIIDLYINEYGDTNISHFCEIVKQDLGVSVSDTTINHWLREFYVLSPKAHRLSKKNMKKLLNEKLDVTQSNKIKNDIKEAISIIDSSQAHPTRPRCKYAGEMIQMDASSYHWVPNQVWHLHLAVDDADGKVVGAFFDTQETLNGYYHVLSQILTNHGIPAMFYTDRRTVFEYKRKNTLLDDQDTFTQFSYACHQLGIEIKTTSVAQAKGRIERLNQTLQSRLPVELRRQHIVDIDAANAFLNSYIKEYNEQFALHLNSKQSVYENQPSKEVINTTLAILSERVVDLGHCIKYQNKTYQTLESDGKRICFKKGSTALVIKAFDGTLYANILDNLYVLEEVPSHQKYSENFDEKVEQKKEKKVYIPPMSHPWKHASFLNYLSKMEHRSSGANL